MRPQGTAVVAAGNSAGDSCGFAPCAVNGTLCVAASDLAGKFQVQGPVLRVCSGSWTMQQVPSSKQHPPSPGWCGSARQAARKTLLQHAAGGSPPVSSC